METMQAIKALLARLARAPMGRERDANRSSTRRGRPGRLASGLYPDPERSPTDARTAGQREGDEAERLACLHLECAGLVFVAANVRYRDGEIDLVMRERGRGPLEGAHLVFVEVRRRRSGSHGGAAASVTRDKRRRVVAAAAHYLVGLGARSLPYCRFDVVTIDGDRREGFRVGWIRDAFRCDE